MKTYLEYAKKILLGCCALLLTAIVITCIFGFNIGQDFKGYIEVKVSIGQYSTLADDYEKEATNEVLEVLKDNGAKIITTNIEGSDFTSILVVEIKNVSKEHSENLAFANKMKEVLENHYNDEMYVISSSVYSRVMTDINIIRITYSILISVIILMIYTIIRTRLLNSICIMATSICSIVVLLSVLTLTRVQLNLNVLGIVVLTFVLSTVLSLLKTTKILNARRKDERYQPLTLDDVEEITFTDLRTIFMALIIVANIVLVIFGSSIVKGYALTVIFAVISVWLTDTFVCLPLNYYIGKTTTPKKVARPLQVEEAEIDTANNG